MKISDFSIANPVKVTVGVILICIFGVLSLLDVPVQLTPEVTKPVVSVETNWPGRSPEEIEQEIVERQEEQLKSIEGMTNFKSTSSQGRGEIEMEFEVGADMNEILVKVASALQQIRDYPEDAERPRLRTVNVNDSPIAWMSLVPLPPEKGEIDAFLELHPELKDVVQEAVHGETIDMPILYRLSKTHPGLRPLVENRVDPTQLRDYVEDVIKPAFERLDGVANSNVYGGQDRQLQVVIDPQSLANRQITIAQLRAALSAQNIDISAGEIWDGNRAYPVRTLGQFDTPEEVESVIVTVQDGKPIFVRDIASVKLGLSRPDGFMHQRGMPSLGCNVQKEEGANVLEVMDAVKATIADLNQTELNPRGLELVQVSDQTTYIKSATELVQSNIIVGGILAVVVLLIFLQNARSTFVVALSIPISVVGTFLIMRACGRSINVISLAGMAFAVGMVVDNAIVVLENIYTYYQRGDSPLRAAARGTAEVWGAVLASTLTTLAVFVPVVFVEEQAGQLFRDIAIAISAAVALSLIVSLTVIPAAASLVLSRRNRFAKTQAFSHQHGNGHPENHDSDVEDDTVLNRKDYSGVFGRIRYMSDVTGRAFNNRLVGLTDKLQAGRFGITAIIVVAAMFFMGLWCLMPSRQVDLGSTRYITMPTWFGFVALAVGTVLFFFMALRARRLAVVIMIVTLAVGLSYRIMPGTEYLPEGNQNLVFARMTPPPGYSVEKMAEIADLIEERLRKHWELEPGSQEAHDQINDLHFENFFTMMRGGGIMVGARSVDPTRAGELVPVIQDATADIPGLIGFASQASLFSRGLSGGRTIDIEITGDNLDKLIMLGRKINGDVMAMYPRETTETSVQATPSLDLGSPELHVRRNLEKASELGLTTADLGYTINAYVDGAYAGDYWEKGRKIDLVITAPVDASNRMEQLEQFPVATPGGQVVRLGDIATITRSSGPDQIVRIDRQRAITIQVKPGPHVALEDAMERIEREIVTPMRESGVLEGGRYQIHLGGTADELRQMISALGGSMLLALVITYLLIAGLYESFLYPLVIMVSVPMAAVGGFLGLRGLNLIKEQPLDTLTMLGFIILIGTVVNNAILIVDQALVLIRKENKPHREAVKESVRGRVRPIFMSTLTTLLGMLPLVLFPGAGSELYRGLGSVVLGGLALSTAFTLILVPMLFTLTYEAQLGIRERLAQAWLRRELRKDGTAYEEEPPAVDDDIWSGEIPADEEDEYSEVISPGMHGLAHNAPHGKGAHANGANGNGSSARNGNGHTNGNSAGQSWQSHGNGHGQGNGHHEPGGSAPGDEPHPDAPAEPRPTPR